MGMDTVDRVPEGVCGDLQLFEGLAMHCAPTVEHDQLVNLLLGLHRSWGVQGEGGDHRTTNHTATADRVWPFVEILFYDFIILHFSKITSQNKYSVSLLRQCRDWESPIMSVSLTGHEGRGIGHSGNGQSHAVRVIGSRLALARAFSPYCSPPPCLALWESQVRIERPNSTGGRTLSILSLSLMLQLFGSRRSDLMSPGLDCNAAHGWRR